MAFGIRLEPLFFVVLRIHLMRRNFLLADFYLSELSSAGTFARGL